MSHKKNKGREKGFTRREFLKKTGMAGAALGVASMAPSIVTHSYAQAKDHILIGHPNPSTGPLAGFGEASPWADEKAIAAINKAGGIMVDGKKLPVKLKLVDTESDPTKAAELASRLILKDKVDLMVVMHTPDTVNPVSAMCERNKMPCISLDNPVEPWLSGGPYKYSFHAFWTVDKVTDLFSGIWDEYAKAGKVQKVVGGLFPNDPDGTAWVEVFSKKLPEMGYKFVDPGRFPYMQKDFTTMISLFKKENVDILTGCLIPPDWITAWKQCHQQGFIPKIATIAKACLFPADVNAQGGDLPAGITTEVWWSPYHPFKSSLTGETAQQLCDNWTKEMNKPWTAPIGFKYAGFEIAADVLKRAGTLNKEKIREALAKTDLDTIVGHIKYNEKNYSETPLVAGQWVKGKKWPWELQVVYNQQAPFIKKTAEMLFPMPK